MGEFITREQRVAKVQVKCVKDRFIYYLHFSVFGLMKNSVSCECYFLILKGGQVSRVSCLLLLIFNTSNVIQMISAKGPFLVASHLISPILANIAEAWVTLTIYHPLKCSINTVLDRYIFT